MKKIVFYLMAVVLLATACNDKLENSSIVTGVTINESAVMLKLGETTTVSAVVEPADACDVVWTSNNDTVATVNQFGGITAIGKGTATIIATTKIGGKVATCTVYVDAIRVSRIELDKVALYLLPEDTASITATIFPEDATDKTVKWTSSDMNVVTIDSIDDQTTGKAKIKATGFGNATITAMTEDGEFKATCVITVSKISVTGLLLAETTFEGVYGETLQLHATILPDNATFPEVIWTSSNEEMAKVSESGLVTITSKEEGSAVIRATSKDNNMFWAECQVTVHKDMSSIVEKVIWEGNVDISWSPDGQIGIAASNFEGVPAGSILTFYFKQKDVWGQVQINNGKWASITGLGINGYLKTGEIGDKSVTSFENVLTQDVLDNILSNHGNFGGVDCGIILQGSDWTMTKVSISISVQSTETVLWEGSVGPIDWSGTDYTPVDASLLTAGQTLGVDFTCDQAAGFWQVEVMVGSWWTDFQNWAAVYGTNQPHLTESETNFEFVITQTDIDNIKQQGSALLFAGNGLIIKRVYVKD